MASNLKSFNVQYDGKVAFTFTNKQHYIVGQKNEIFFILNEFCRLLTNGWTPTSGEFKKYLALLDSVAMGKLEPKCMKKELNKLCIISGLGIWALGCFLRFKITDNDPSFRRPDQGEILEIMKAANWLFVEEYQKEFKEYVDESEKQKNAENTTKTQPELLASQNPTLTMRYGIENPSQLTEMIIEDRLNKKVLYQKEAIKHFTSEIYGHIFTDQKQREVPTVIHLVGPSGVGKTTTIKELADILNIKNTPALVIKQGTSLIDEASVSQLQGAGPSYQGYDSPQPTLVEELTVAINYAAAHETIPVLFLDEIHEAHRNIFTTLRALVDNSFQDAKGARCFTQNLLFICGSNFAAAGILHHQMESEKKRQPQDRGYILKLVSDDMKEKKLDFATISRMGTPIPYRSFSEDEMQKILNVTVTDAFTDYLAVDKQILIHRIDKTVLEALMEGYDRRFGVRLQESAIKKAVNRLSQRLSGSIDRKAHRFTVLVVPSATACSTKLLRLESVEDSSVTSQIEFYLTSYRSQQGLNQGQISPLSLSSLALESKEIQDEPMQEVIDLNLTTPIFNSLKLNKANDFGIPVLFQPSNAQLNETYICSTSEWVDLLRCKYKCAVDSFELSKKFSSFLTQQNKKLGRGCIGTIKLTDSNASALRGLLLKEKLLNENTPTTRLFEANILIQHWNAFMAKLNLENVMMDSVSNSKKRKIDASSNVSIKPTDPDEAMASSFLDVHFEKLCEAIGVFADYKDRFVKYMNLVFTDPEAAILNEEYDTTSQMNKLFGNILVDNDRLSIMMKLYDKFEESEQCKSIAHTLDIVRENALIKLAGSEDWLRCFTDLSYGALECFSLHTQNDNEGYVKRQLCIALFSLMELLVMAGVQYPSDPPLAGLAKVIDILAENAVKALPFSDFFLTMEVLMSLPNPGNTDNSMID